MGIFWELNVGVDEIGKGLKNKVFCCTVKILSMFGAMKNSLIIKIIIFLHHS